MDNKTFLEQNKNKFLSLRFFDIQNDYLVLNTKTAYMLPLKYTKLSQLPLNIFNLHPVDIYKIIYMFEFLHKPEITEKEKSFIENYTKNYLEINHNTKENNNSDSNTIWGLGLPIHFAYNEEFINNPASNIIRTIIENKEIDIETGKEKVEKLVLIKGNNSNFDIPEKIDNIKTFEKAGFTSILLIISSITATCLYIAYFIIGK